MKPELDKKIVSECPLLYADRHASIYESAMPWGFCVGDGWYELIYELSIELEKEIEKIAEADPGKEYPRAVQVKEKFGTLRFYISCFNDKIDSLIREAEKKSAETCENCGLPGELDTSRYWVKTLCEFCRKGDK